MKKQDFYINTIGGMDNIDYPKVSGYMEVFLWLILIWIVALCPPIGFIIGILALLGTAIGSCFRR